jgi:hypothetical protein
MKRLALVLLLSGTALGQAPSKLITFDRIDTAHCKVVVASGRPLLESTYEGTSVAITLPVNRGNGEFLIFVAISRAGAGAIRVDPQDFFGLYSDAARTRFVFYDKAAELAWQANGQAGSSDMSASNANVDPGSIRPGEVVGGPGGGGPPPGSGPPGGPPAAAALASSAYLRRSKVKPGEKVVGWVVLRQTKGAKIEVHSADMLGEVDIPVNGIVFRF